MAFLRLYVLATFLGYLSDVSEGGRTVFPGIDISVKPEKNSALFWLTVDSSEEYDSRMYHMGCPVRKGNKWVLKGCSKKNVLFSSAFENIFSTLLTFWVSKKKF